MCSIIFILSNRNNIS